MDIPKEEITMEDVKTYCESRNLVVISKDLFEKMNNAADKFYLYLKDGKTMIRVLDSTTLNNSEKPNKWIPVSERLPEERGYYLTTMLSNDGYHRYRGITYFGDDKQWTRGCNILAWMPLPEPWKEGEDA